MTELDAGGDEAEVGWFLEAGFEPAPLVGSEEGIGGAGVWAVVVFVGRSRIFCQRGAEGTGVQHDDLQGLFQGGIGEGIAGVDAGALAAFASLRLIPEAEKDFF